MSGFLNSDEESNVVRNLLEEFQMVETQMEETQEEEDADATHAREFAAFLWQQLPGNNDEEDEEEDEEKKEKVCEVDCSVCTAKPIFAVPEGFNLSECPICYENMEMINVTIARCGHTFHASCLFKALELKIDCPMCRTQLINILDDDGEDDDDESNIDDESNNDSEYEDDLEDEDIEDESEIRKVTHEQLATKLTHIGYTAADFLRIAGCRVKSENDGKYDCAFHKKFHKDVEKIILGEIKLADRDTRTYAQVVGDRNASEVL